MKFTKDGIRVLITNNVVAEFLTSDYNEKLGLYADGSITFGESVGREIDPDERAIAVISCPAISNISVSMYTEGWTKKINGYDEYLTDDGRTLSFDECVVDCCKNGDIEADRDDITNGLFEDMQNDE